MNTLRETFDRLWRAWHRTSRWTAACLLACGTLSAGSTFAGDPASDAFLQALQHRPADFRWEHLRSDHSGEALSSVADVGLWRSPDDAHTSQQPVADITRPAAASSPLQRSIPRSDVSESQPRPMPELSSIRQVDHTRVSGIAGVRTADFESDASRREPAQAPASGLWDQSPLAERNGPENEPVRNPLAASAGGAATQATTDALLGSVPRMRPGTLPPGMENASYAEQVDEILRRWEIERMQDALALEHARQKKAELAREEAARTQALSRIRTVSNEDPTHSLFDGPGLVPVSGSSGLLAQDDSAGAEPSLAPGLGAQPDLPAQQPQGLPRFDRLPGENGEENLRPGIGIEYPQLSDNQPKNRHPMRDFALIQPYNDYSPQEVALCPEDGARCPRYWDLPDTTQPERYHGHLEFYWQPSNLFYQPLYFEDPHLERYGHNYGFFQPLVSVGRFGVQLVGLPYQMALHPPCECVSPLGYYRPGECAPKQRDAVPLNAGAAVESGIIYTAIGVGFPF